MRKVFALAMLAFSALHGVADAQEQAAPDFARVSLATFIGVCVETQGDRAAALERLRVGGWTQATVADIPRMRRGPRGQVFAPIEGAAPADAVVFVGRTPANDVMVAVLGTYQREQGRGRERRSYSVAGCSLYALGATPQALAQVLYPGDSLGRAVFIDEPVTTTAVRGRSFTVAASRPALESAYAAWESIGYYHHESAPLH